MILKCINKNNETCLTLGKFYRPIEIYNGKNGVMYRLMGDDNETPAIYSAINFEIVDSNLPLNWLISVTNENMTLTHKLFQRAGFWEDFFNEDKYAVETFKRLTKQISLINITQNFVSRFKHLSWANIKYLIEEKWMSCSLACDFAMKKVSLDKNSETELYLAGLGKGDEVEILNILNEQAKKDELDMDVIADILVTWGFENNSILDDPLQFVEEIYFKFNQPEKINHFVRYLAREVSEKDLLFKWKSYLDSEVYSVFIEPS